ncbi:10034_t:CDS:2 [Paraglomus brasilianum]|uniref:10034_t:CDS:1 n=1 Tax=Paraglomus brasilianum TaxID=144538 RepID=A0A9N9C966_9GLOM|nr:10034_t:CDS:2 [Paraglomus brasilianum]
MITVAYFLLWMKGPSLSDSVSSIASVGRKRRIDKLTKIAESNKKQKADGKLEFSEFGKASAKVFDAFGLDQFGPDRFKPPSVTLPDTLVNKIFEELKASVQLNFYFVVCKARFRANWKLIRETCYVFDGFQPIGTSDSVGFNDFREREKAEHVGNVKILLEHELNGIEVPANGNVEYVIMIEGKIILLLEAKVDDFAMGRAQNYVECEVGYELNCSHQSYIYGIVTNSAQWFFNRLDSDSVKECLESILFDVDGLPTRNSVRHVSCIIAGIIEDMKEK